MYIHHSHGFPGHEIQVLCVDLPPLPTRFGLLLKDNELWQHIPYIHAVEPGSFASRHMPTSSRRNHCILSINNDIPITAAGVREVLHSIQASTNLAAVKKELTMMLVPLTWYSKFRSKNTILEFFDSMR